MYEQLNTHNAAQSLSPQGELVMKLIMCHRFSKFPRGSALPKCHCASTWTTTRYIGHLIAHPHDMFAHPAHSISITARTMAHTHVRSHAFTLSSRTGTAELQRTGSHWRL